MDSEIQGMDFINQRPDVADDLQLNLGRTLCFAEFSAQVFSSGFAESSKIFVPVVVREWKARHWHAGDPRVTIYGERFQL